MRSRVSACSTASGVPHTTTTSPSLNRVSAAGSRPTTLFDFFPNDYLLVLDESHVTVPQIGGMYEGDRSRKTVLVDHGFRLPSALDNRPLNFLEFQGMQNQTIYVSATPGARAVTV